MFPYLRQTRQKPLKNDRGRIVGTWTKAKYGLARESGAPGGIGYVGAACPLAGSFSTDATRLSFPTPKRYEQEPWESILHGGGLDVGGNSGGDTSPPEAFFPMSPTGKKEKIRKTSNENPLQPKQEGRVSEVWRWLCPVQQQGQKEVLGPEVQPQEGQGHWEGHPPRPRRTAPAQDGDPIRTTENTRPHSPSWD